MYERRKAISAKEIDAQEIASRKKAKPSRAKGRPITEPENWVKVGQSGVISNSTIVPETAPMAKAFDQRRARASQVASLCHKASPSAIQSLSGKPTPSTEKMM